jgi:hypothetical protein
MRTTARGLAVGFLAFALAARARGALAEDAAEAPARDAAG